MVALGGNALARPGGSLAWDEAVGRMRATAPALAELVADGHDLILTHGNGPQVGALLRQVELAEREVPRRPLSALNAETEGQIGYLIQQELTPALDRAGAARTVLVLVSRVEVSPKDPAFRTPTKPVGRFYSEEEARLLRKREGWQLVFDGARGGWRRLVPSPRPVAWLEASAVRLLMEGPAAHLVVPVVAGGGGVPVVRGDDGTVQGVDAVIDKDLSSALVARELRAAALVIVTDVPAVALGFGKAWERWVGATTASEMQQALEAGEFAEGSMRPKVEAGLEFLANGGERVIITDIPSLRRAMRNDAGTRITRGA
ncbi:MAG TPA: carbamate kinase [Thermoplasmata archaeon]|nr:carbamate kinase [Thermoplasmata archaeon]